MLEELNEFILRSVQISCETPEETHMRLTGAFFSGEKVCICSPLHLIVVGETTEPLKRSRVWFLLFLQHFIVEEKSHLCDVPVDVPGSSGWCGKLYD